MDSFEARLASIEEKVDAHLRETRPIWERALAEIADVRNELSATKAEVGKKIDDAVAGIREEFHKDIDKAVAGLKGDIEQAALGLRGDIDKAVAVLREEFRNAILALEDGLRSEMNSRFDKVDHEAAQYRKEFNLGLHKVDRRIEVVAMQFVTISADMRMLEDQVEAMKAQLTPPSVSPPTN